MNLDDIIIESGDLSDLNELVELYDVYSTYEIIRKKNTNIFRNSFNITSLFNKYEVVESKSKNKNSINIEYVNINNKKRSTIKSVINFFKFKNCN